MDKKDIKIFCPVIGYTGMVHSDYMMSMIDLLSEFRKENINQWWKQIEKWKSKDCLNFLERTI